jgi:hypothetical protein
LYVERDDLPHLGASARRHVDEVKKSEQAKMGYTPIPHSGIIFVEGTKKESGTAHSRFYIFYLATALIPKIPH